MHPLSSTESNDSNIECELLGLLFSITHFNLFTFGRLVHAITDHKCLVSLFRNSLVDSSPRLTRMLFQFLDYTLEVTYQTGVQMHLSDAISWLSTHDNSKGTTLQNLDVSIHTIKELTGFNSLSVDKICQHTRKTKPCSCWYSTTMMVFRTPPQNFYIVSKLISTSEMNSVSQMVSSWRDITGLSFQKSKTTSNQHFA